MKLMSIDCPFEDLPRIKKLLADEHLPIFRTLNIKDVVDGVGQQLSGYKVVFYVMDQETETALKLRYPPGTFHTYGYT